LFRAVESAYNLRSAFLEDRDMLKVFASIFALAATVSFSTSAVAMGDCGGGQTPMTPKPTTCSGG
jgi:hypothetical protein